MGHRTLSDCVHDLERSGQLVRIEEEVDARLEAAAIHRRVCRAGGPALLFTRPKNSTFPLVSNLFGTLQRARYLFRDTLRTVERLVALKADPSQFGRRPLADLAALRGATRMRPRIVRTGPVLSQEITLSQLPRLTCWPRDGGPFITLPQVYSEDPRRPGWRNSNLGMYRVQLAGNRYRPDAEAGLHYQIHRGIGVHHAAAIAAGRPLRISIGVGGPPAMSVAAVMPLPEGMSELGFAGVLGGRRVPWLSRPGLPGVHAQADFCLTGYIDPDRLLPEGPFGDHLGYYALVHDFPVLRVESVRHRPGAIWPFTVVGRPPQEDTTFGKFIHELTGPLVPSLLSGVKAVHAVDAAGVHPLMLAIGSERYVPYAAIRQPRELLTQANAILGQGQMSLAKYLWIAATEDDPGLDIHDIGGFLRHVLARVDWRRDLHFQTNTTIDTLDYSGGALNEGSKLVIAAAGPPRRELPHSLSGAPWFPSEFGSAQVVMQGVLAVQGPTWRDAAQAQAQLDEFCRQVASTSSGQADDPLPAFPLIVVCDDSRFAAASLENFLWVTFTRSNPAADVYGVDSFWEHKHWGCRGSLVIDARTKPHHAPPLEEDPETVRRVEALAAPGGPLHGLY